MSHIMSIWLWNVFDNGVIISNIILQKINIGTQPKLLNFVKSMNEKSIFYVKNYLNHRNLSLGFSIKNNTLRQHF